MGQALAAVFGLIVGSTTDSWLIGVIVWVVGAVVLRWDSRSLEIEGQAEALREVEGHTDLHLEADAEGTRAHVPLHRDVPGLGSIGRGRGDLTGLPVFDAFVRVEGGSEAWAGFMLADVRAALLTLIGHLGYDRARHALIVSADDGPSHATLKARVRQAQTLANRLRRLSRVSAVDRLRERMAQTEGADRLPVFKALWRADRRAALALGAELSDPEVRYFIATSSTPPDRAIIEAVAYDSTLTTDLRAEAMLRWLGLSAGLGGDDLEAAFAGLRSAPDDTPHAPLLTGALDAWIQCAPTSDKALLFLGKYGHAAHVGVIGAQRRGDRADAAQKALSTLRERFPGLGSGHLAIASDGAGQLALTQDAPGPEAD